MTHVHMAKGRRYHADRDCPALLDGQALCGTLDSMLRGAWICMPEESALERGATPCRVCFPGRQLPPCGHDFGHQPYLYDGVLICQRCWTGDDQHREVVAWPCTTARILRLDQP